MADTIRTEADLLENSFQDGQANNSISAQDLRDLVVTARYLQPLGWEFIFDMEFPDNNTPLTMTGGVPTKLTLDSDPSQELRFPPDFPGIWDDVNNKLTPPILDGAGLIRLSLASQSTTSTNSFDLILDVGNDPVAPAGGGTASNIIYTRTSVFAKGANTEQNFNFILPLFVGVDFAANGGHFIITPENTIRVFSITLTGLRIFAPSPAGPG